MIDRLNKFFLFLLNKQYIRFLIVGGINTIFGYCMFALFIYLNFHYAVAAFLSTTLGILFNFKTTGVIVFKNNDNKLIINFFLVYGILYIINVGWLKIFNMFAFSNYIAGLILLLPSAVIGFFLNKIFVFKK